MNNSLTITTTQRLNSNYKSTELDEIYRRDRIKHWEGCTIGKIQQTSHADPKRLCAASQRSATPGHHAPGRLCDALDVICYQKVTAFDYIIRASLPDRTTEAAESRWASNGSTVTMPYAESMASLRLDSSSDMDFDGQSVTGSQSIDLSSERALLSRRRHSTASIQTFQTTSTSRTLTGLKTLRQVALGPLVFIPVLARVAAARKELATIRRKSLPSPLFEQRKVLDELLQLSEYVR